ncbi:hypothetical protein [Aurantibacillus circumpalustris]|uniref:hypothetical protein n=1 Tax=Aurantibacillus circumpalustris TaxID=3036359 RepID=UPI00295B71CE|nr:hypothetical protein [Aurantibacillus circumpalustris]
MSAKKIIYSIALISFSSILIFSACKKKKDPEPIAVQTPDAQGGTDSREAQGENDAAVNEINEVISNSKRASGRSSSTEATTGICGFDVDSVKITQDTILLKYNGVTCLNRKRTGVIRLTWQHGTKWKNIGAVIKVEYLNYKVLRPSDQKSVMLNGTQNLTNVSGGTWIDLVFFNQALITTVTGSNLQVTFEDSKTAIYNINRKLTYTFPNGIITAKAEGIGNNGTAANLENYGTTRNGDVFISQVTTPIIWNITCGGAVLQGAVTVSNTTKNVDLKFLYGVDASGNIQTVAANDCPYGWKLEWTFNGNSNSKVISYK